jgi:spermidine synthase
MQLILFNIGLISLLSQVILLRELAVAFYGVELIYLFALGVWLFFTAAGAMISGYRIATAGAMTVAFLCLAVLLPLDVLFIRASRLLFAGVPGAYLPFYQQLLVPVVAIFPIGLLTGFLFPLAATIFIQEKPDSKRTLAGAYGIESLGALVGGIIPSLFLKYDIPVLAATLLGSALIVLIPLSFIKKVDYVRRPSLAFAVCCLIALNWTSWLDRMTIGWNHPHLVQSQDTAYGRITLTGMSGQAAVFENDVLSFETEGPEGETFAHLTALQHPNPRKVLLLGGGMEGLVEALRQHPIERIDVVELNSRMVQMVSRHLPPQRRSALNNPPVRLIFADPRDFLRHSDTYDLILVAMPDPASGQTNRFYTREFFQICADRLSPGGVMGMRLRSAENIWPPPLMYRMSSIYGALKSVFPHILFLPGTTNIVTAASTPLADDAATLIERWQSRRISARLVRPPYINYLFTNDRFQEIRKILQTTVIPANSDIRPVCYRYTLQIWLSKFFPRASFLDITLPLPAILFSLAVTLAVTTGAFFLARSHPSIRRLFPGKRVFMAGLAGFCGMVLQNVLLLHYQVKDGALYQDIGLLIASFMAGLALGAMLLPRCLSFPDRRWGRVLLGGFFSLTILIYFVLIRDGGTGLFVMACLLAFSGFFTGTLFAYTTITDTTARHSLVSPLYAADLVGGGSGALLGGLLLIPAAGLDIPVQIVSTLILLSFLIV